ncbi:MAG: peptidoglycan editing factor PgeF [Eubacteriales bacterium]|nr:peptidoglycan editing factor PgeF [Eubacteriales bacterium]
MECIHTGYTYEQVGEVGIYRLPLFSAQKGIDHGFSARTGGVSEGCFASLNLSFTRPEDRKKVVRNYEIFCDAANIPLQSMVMDTYEHGTTILRVDRNDCGKGYLLPSLPACDGLVTNDPNVTLMTGHADCMAFYCYDSVNKCIGLAHAGWRGALNRIGSQLIKMMKTEYGSNPTNILVGVGPSICPKCFEVGEDVAADFEKAYPNINIRGTNEKGNPTIDLWKVAAEQFLEQGVKRENIELMGVCTMEDDRLYSHRRDKGKTGGMTAFLRILTT